MWSKCVIERSGPIIALLLPFRKFRCERCSLDSDRPLTENVDKSFVKLKKNMPNIYHQIVFNHSKGAGCQKKLDVRIVHVSTNKNLLHGISIRKSL